LTKLRSPQDVSQRFRAVAIKLGFQLRLHDLRGTHETLLLDAGVPVHVVAATPSALVRRIDRRRVSSGNCPVASLENENGRRTNPLANR
jgi:hypothetical protein